MSKSSNNIPFLKDEQIELTSENDFLNGASYADILTKSILAIPSSDTFTIGLFGEWGSGKSSIIETSQKNLSTSSTQKIAFIKYDAWKYAKDSFRRMFLLEVQESLNYKRKPLLESFYQNRTHDVKIRKKINPTSLTLIILTIIIGLLSIFSTDFENNVAPVMIGVFINFFALLLAMFFKAFDDLKVSIQKPPLFAPEQFEKYFREMITNSLKKNTTIENLTSFFRGENHSQENDKVVILIDNIDRCSKELAYELLTDTKGFLSSIPGVIFLVPVDDESLKKHLRKNNTNEKEAEEFLRKFFNLTIRIKPLKLIEIYEYTCALNKHYKLGFNPDTIDIISKEYATNPRRVKQFINNLLIELESFKRRYSHGFATDNQSLICKFLILREEWPEFYKLICKYPYLVNDMNTKKENLLQDNPDLIVFLSNTRAISERTAIDIFELVLSNNDVFQNIGQDLQDAIHNSNGEAVIRAIEKNPTSLTEVLNFINEELRKGLQRKAYKTLVNRQLNLVYELYTNPKISINASENRRIQNLIQPDLSQIIFNTTNAEPLVAYLNLIISQGFHYLIEFITQTINDHFAQEDVRPSIYSDILGELVTNLELVELLDKLTDSFSKFIDNSEHNLRKFVTKRNIQHIYSDKLFQVLKSRINSNDEYQDIFLDFILIIENIQLSEEDGNEILEALDNLFDSFDNYEKGDLMIILELLRSYFRRITHQNHFSSGESIISKLLAERVTEKGSTTLISECLDSTEEIEIIVDLLENIYESTNNEIETQEFYEEIIFSSNANQEIGVRSMLDLIDIWGFSIRPLYDQIFRIENLTDSVLELLGKILISKGSNGEYHLSSEDLESKVSNLAGLIFSNAENSEQISRFFETIIEDNRVRESLTDQISRKSKEEILNLSPSLQKLSFDRFTEGDNLFSYVDDLELLKAIASSGEKGHVLKLSRVIISMLQKEETVQNAFELIDATREFNNKDRNNIISQLENLIDSDSNSEEAKSLIKKLKKT